MYEIFINKIDNKNLYKKTYFLSPFVGNIGTKNAFINSAKSLSKYSKHKIYLLNVLVNLTILIILKLKK